MNCSPFVCVMRVTSYELIEYILHIKSLSPIILKEKASCLS